MPLTDTAVKNLKPGGKTYRVSDEKGMYLEVTPSGGKLWRIKYRFDGKQKPLALGRYPEVSLRQARERRDEARKMLADGVDPGEARKEAKTAKEAEAANTFGRIAEEWFEVWQEGKAADTVKHVKDRLDNYILPILAERPVAEIEAPDVLEALRPIEAKSLLDTVQRVKGCISQVLQHAIATGRRKMADPCPYLNKVIKTNTVKHHPGFTKPEDVARLLKLIDSHATNPQTSPFVSAALKLLPMVFCRPSELVTMKWADVDLGAAEWHYRVSKVKIEHNVPLSRQAVAILTGLRELADDSEWVFPSQRGKSRHISSVTTNRALQDLGIDTENEHTSHGFRTTARTMLAERLDFEPEWIERQLSHRVPDPLGDTYNRTTYRAQRKEMMQAWSDYLDELRTKED